MKRIQLLALVAFSMIGQIAYPYAIVNDKNSSDSATIYVFKDKNKYLDMLKAHGVPNEVLQYADKVAAAAPAIGAALAAPTEGASLIVAQAVPISVQGAKLIVNALEEIGLMSEVIRKLAGNIALHRNVKPGNQGRGAEWNWKSIQDQYGIKQGGTVYVVVTDKEKGVPVLQTTLASDGLLGFTIKKEPNGQFSAVQSPAAVSQYVPAK